MSSYCHWDLFISKNREYCKIENPDSVTVYKRVMSKYYLYQFILWPQLYIFQVAIDNTIYDDVEDDQVFFTKLFNEHSVSCLPASVSDRAIITSLLSYVWCRCSVSATIFVLFWPRHSTRHVKHANVLSIFVWNIKKLPMHVCCAPWKV